MRARTAALITAAFAVAMAPALAAPPAGKKKPAIAKPTTAKKAQPAKAKSRATTTKRGSKGRGRKRVQPNMPRGWAWPPTKAMIAAGEACTRQLDTLGVVWKPAKNEEASGRIVTPITVPSMELGGIKVTAAWRKAPHVMDCHLALGFAVYGPQLAAIGVRELKFSSIYRNTPVRAHGQTKNILSRHALGLAIDVRAFVDSAGREAVVETDYPAADTMLLGVEQVINDTDGWRTVLTPRNDPVSHYDHFHLEIKVDYEHHVAPAADAEAPATETAAVDPAAPAP